MNFLQYMAFVRRRKNGTLSREDEVRLKTYEQTKAGKDDQRIWEVSGQYQKSYKADPQAGLARFRQRLLEEERKKPTSLRTAKWPSSSWLVAATVAILLSVVWFTWQPFANDSPSWEKVVADNAVQQIRLVDGTEITLNKGAILQYPTSFKQMSDRRVRLSGEAYFAVSKMPNKVFVIETPQAEVEVLGTAFNLRAQPHEAFTEVEVAEGRVALRKLAEEDHIILEAKECGSYMHGAGELKKEAAPMLNRLAWHTHRLHFVKTPLKDVVPMLERYFDIQIEGAAVLDDLECPITGDWTKGELQKIAEVIEALTPLSLTAAAGDGTYRLVGQGCR